MSWDADPIAAVNGFDWDSHTSIAGSRAGSRETIDRLREAIGTVVVPEHVFIGITGSLGRLEATARSDVDFGVYAIRSYGGSLDDLDGLVTECRDQLKALDKPLPNPDGAFASPIYLQQESIDRIGRQGSDGDSNFALTHRMLLLCESTFVVGEDAWRSGVSDIRSAYLEHHKKPAGPPRFLLNDIVRYWRTMCVDFQGKMIERNDSGWGTRNAKLRMSRKLLFASSALPLFMTIGAPLDRVDPILDSWFSLVPLERLVAAARLLNVDMLVPELLDAYDRFLELLETRRDELEAIDPMARDSNETWQAFHEIEEQFQGGLERLFFDSALAPAIRRYGLL